MAEVVSRGVYAPIGLVQEEFGYELEWRDARIAVAAKRTTTDPVMWKIVLVAIHTYKVLERTGDSRLSMCLKLGQVVMENPVKL